MHHAASMASGLLSAEAELQRLRAGLADAYGAERGQMNDAIADVERVIRDLQQEIRKWPRLGEDRARVSTSVCFCGRPACACQNGCFLTTHARVRMGVF
jgi:hypothetical protein